MFKRLVLFWKETFQQNQSVSDILKNPVTNHSEPSASVLLDLPATNVTPTFSASVRRINTEATVIDVGTISHADKHWVEQAKEEAKTDSINI